MRLPARSIQPGHPLFAFRGQLPKRNNLDTHYLACDIVGVPISPLSLSLTANVGSRRNCGCSRLFDEDFVGCMGELGSVGVLGSDALRCAADGAFGNARGPTRNRL